jgi:hypothetical protein
MNRLILLVFVVAFGNACNTRKEYKIANCSDVWNGEFYDIHNGKVMSEIRREGNKQTEKSPDGSVSELKVEWLDSCRYRLVYVSGNKVSQSKELKPVIVQITAVNQDSYSIEGWIEENNFSTYSSKMMRKRKKN